MFIIFININRQIMIKLFVYWFVSNINDFNIVRLTFLLVLLLYLLLSWYFKSTKCLFGIRWVHLRMVLTSFLLTLNAVVNRILWNSQGGLPLLILVRLPSILIMPFFSNIHFIRQGCPKCSAKGTLVSLSHSWLLQLLYFPLCNLSSFEGFR